jgi:hypothetical protein
MANKKKTIKSYAFIDTNIFLDFYRNQNEPSHSLLKKLEGVKERIICTYQVQMEFLKNRQRVIIDNWNSIKSTLETINGNSQLSSIIKKEIKEHKKDLQEQTINFLKSPADCDPVYKSLETIFTSSDAHVLTRDMKIRHKIERLAWRRFIFGQPPRKSQDTSIGDALNWEWFVHCCKELIGEFIIVSRDKDYGTHCNGQEFLDDALKSEFRDRVGQKSITLTTKLSDALKLLEVSVTEAEEEAEEDQITNSSEQKVIKKVQEHFKKIQFFTPMKLPNMEVLQRIADASKKMDNMAFNEKFLDKLKKQQEIYKSVSIKKNENDS